MPATLYDRSFLPQWAGIMIENRPYKNLIATSNAVSVPVIAMHCTNAL